jgi:hypothetical protein
MLYTNRHKSPQTPLSHDPVILLPLLSNSQAVLSTAVLLMLLSQ